MTVAKSCPESYRVTNQHHGGISFSRVNPDTIGCVWTGDFDFNTLRVDGEIYESGKKKLRTQKYPDTRLDGALIIESNNSIIFSLA